MDKSSRLLKLAYYMGKEAALATIGKDALKALYQKGLKDAGSEVLGARAAQYLGMPAIGAGIGALSSDDTGRGAAIGALAGLGGAAGLHAGTRQLGKMYERLGAKAHTILGRAGGDITPEMRRAATWKVFGEKPRWKNLLQNSLVKGGLLGAGGAAGAGYAASQYLPKQESSWYDNLSLGLSPETQEQLGGLAQQATPYLQQYLAAQQGQQMQPGMEMGATPEEQYLTPEEIAYYQQQGYY
jgi:hypothetical protein